MKKFDKIKKINEANILLEKRMMNEDDRMGINLRSLLDGELAMAVRSIDLSNYKERNDFISKIEERLMDSDWISMSNGTTFQKSFTP